ncbi:MAG: UDP-N-acetylmuramoyl-tripeptide--D-alanyl-D-alanine ligase [Patescibacteria group bacterium]|nr:UDP-N-acetylmuramoyl-tripeptide--D-alanyl-D-alanine ligase [Patescibacteria group bacterium]MDE2438580.1 UDP-N-acetylmuramoyl-tripeptide--D-alanyl-D-alanine ligase [Patescibacteria group bacterium]
MSLFRRSITVIVRNLAHKTLLKFQPGIIAVTGSVGKTSTKEAIYTVLRADRSVRRSQENLNNMLGVSLAIVGDFRQPPKASLRAVWFWVNVLVRGYWHLWFGKSYPELLVLEYGVDRPHDMDELVRFFPPQIGVVTALGDIPPHVEFFDSPDALYREKEKLVRALPSTGFAVLNHDDEAVWEMCDETRAHVMSYGFSEEAHVAVLSYEHTYENDMPRGMSFKIQYDGKTIPLVLNALGRPQLYSATAAIAVGLIFGLNLVKIAQALEGYTVMSGRGNLIPGIKHTSIVDSSYNASPASMDMAIETLASLTGIPRRVAILGDMLEIGMYSTEAHLALGRHAASRVDYLIAVGARGTFIAEGAKEAGMAEENLSVFATTEELLPHLDALIHEGDCVVVKASHAMHFEKVIEEIRYR